MKDELKRRQDVLDYLLKRNEECRNAIIQRGEFEPWYLEFGVDVPTAVSLACQYGRPEVIQKLLDFQHSGKLSKDTFLFGKPPKEAVRLQREGLARRIFVSFIGVKGKRCSNPGEYWPDNFLFVFNEHFLRAPVNEASSQSNSAQSEAQNSTDDIAEKRLECLRILMRAIRKADKTEYLSELMNLLLRCCTYATLRFFFDNGLVTTKEVEEALLAHTSGLQVHNNHIIIKYKKYKLFMEVMIYVNEFFSRVKVFLEIKGVNINARDADGATVLHNLMNLGVSKVLKLFLEQDGIDFFVTDKNGNNVLSRARDNLSPASDAIAVFLEEAGPDNAKRLVTEENASGHSELSEAVVALKGQSRWSFSKRPHLSRIYRMYVEAAPDVFLRDYVPDFSDEDKDNVIEGLYGDSSQELGPLLDIILAGAFPQDFDRLITDKCQAKLSMTFLENYGNDMATLESVCCPWNPLYTVLDLGKEIGPSFLFSSSNTKHLDRIKRRIDVLAASMKESPGSAQAWMYDDDELDHRDPVRR